MLDIDATVLAAGMDAFGEIVTWTPAGGAPQMVPAVFWDNAIETKFQNGMEVVERIVQLSLRLSQCAGAPAQGDTFLVRGVAYLATETRPDGVGAMRVRIGLADDAQASVAAAPPVPVAP
jgi:hypothetical protein